MGYNGLTKANQGDLIMKKINAKELVSIMANKLGLEVEINNFKEFKNFIEEIYSQFVTKWDSLDSQAYYWHDVNSAERIFTIPTKVLQAVYEEANAKFNIAENDGEFYDNDEEERIRKQLANGEIDEDTAADMFMKSYDNPFDIEGAITTVNYVDCGATSAEEFLNYWHAVCKKFGCEMEVLMGTADNCAYCNHLLQWKISANGIKSQNSFFEIPDDNEREVMDALYWLCENFYVDTFEGFEKLGVELRYYQKETEDWE